MDPLAEQTMDPYLYTGNNPIMFTDPTGLSAEMVDAPGDEFKTLDDAAKDFGKEYNGLEITLAVQEQMQQWD